MRLRSLVVMMSANHLAQEVFDVMRTELDLSAVGGCLRSGGWLKNVREEGGGWSDRGRGRGGKVSFLARYRAELLIRRELPAILGAYRHARSGQLRELIHLDQATRGLQGDWAAFDRASVKTGQRQLSSLRPLTDERVLTRYRQAVEAGDAQGWHTLVYGVLLCVYQIPLRQGLTHYAKQSLVSLAIMTEMQPGAAGGEKERWLADFMKPAGAAIEALLSEEKCLQSI